MRKLKYISFVLILIGLFFIAYPSGLLIYAAEESGGVMGLIEVAYPNTFKYIDGELDTIGRFKEYLVNEKNILLGRGLTKTDPTIIEIIARIDDVEKEIKDLAKLRNNIQSDLITLTNNNAIISAFKEKLGPLSDTELQVRLVEVQKLKKEAGLVVNNMQRDLKKNRDKIAVTGNNANQKQLRYVSHITKIDLAKQNSIKGKLNSEVMAIQQLLNQREQLARNTSKVPTTNGVIAHTIGKIGKSANMISRIPLPSTIRDIYDDLRGKTPQNYIDEYQTAIHNNESEITLIDRKIASLKNEISAIEYRNRNMDMLPHEKRWDGRVSLQNRQDDLYEKRAVLEEKIQWLEELILMKSLQRDERELMKPNTIRHNRVQT